MNTTGCPLNYATDQVMLYGNDLKLTACDVFLPVYHGLFGSLTAVRVLVSLYLLRKWFERRRAQIRNGKTRQRFPVFSGTLFLAGLVLCLFTILTSFNLVNSSNNGSATLLCLFYFPSILVGYLSMNRVLRLGKRIIPLSKTSIIRDKITTQSERFNALEKMDLIIRILFFIIYAIFLMNVLAMLVFGFIFQGSFIPVQIGFFSYAAMDILIGLGLAYQYQRVIWAISSIDSGIPSSNSRDEIYKVIRRMRWIQAFSLFYLMGVSVAWLLPVAKIIRPKWW